MCQEFHCECCSDNLPLMDCVCDGCFHDDESIKESHINTNPNTGKSVHYTGPAKDEAVLQGDNGEGDSCQNDGGVKVPSCCKGENKVNKKSCCEEARTDDSGFFSPNIPCGKTSSCAGEEEEEENSCYSSQRNSCGTTLDNPEKKHYCSPKNPEENVQEKFSKPGGEEEEEEETNSCCSSRENACTRSTSSCVEINVPGKKPRCSSGDPYRGAEDTQEKLQKSIEEAKAYGTTSSCDEVIYPKNKICCDERDSCSRTLQEQSRCSKSEKQSPATCCSDTKDRCSEEGHEKEFESRESKGNCCENNSDTGLLIKPSDDKNQAPSCSHMKKKFCEKDNKGKCGSKVVEVSCCQIDEETVLLIEPFEEQPVPESSVAAVKTRATTPRRHTTKLRVQNICCAMEAQLVQDCLKPLEGIENVAVNVIGRVVHVRHDPEVTSPTVLVDSLNKVHLGATVMEMGAHQDKDNEKIPFRLKLGLIYILVQTVFLISAVVGLFLKQPWHMWVAITEIIFGGAPIFKRALLSVKNRKIDINILLLIAIIGTLAISEWVEGATVVYCFAFADALQEFCMFRVQRTISKLMLKRPEVAVLAETGATVPIESVAIGTLIAIRPGELVPLDGLVVKGKASVDESSITGESLPVEKTVLSKVYSGTVNQNGYIEVETTSDSSTSTVSKVAQMVQEAQSSSTKIEAIINRFAKYYTPLVVVVAILVVIVPAILGASGVGSYLEEIREWGRRALVILVIACPCALVMATPIAVVCSITSAARKGALVKGGEHLETLSKIEVLAFDKTGTLTEGKFQVMNMECAYEENERDVLRLAAGLESKSVHPIAAAIVNEFSGCVAKMVKNQITTLPEVTQFKMYEGQGISGMIEGKLVRVGNKEMVDQCGASLTEAMADKYKLWSSESNTVVFVCVDEKLSLMIALADAIRPNTSISLDWLKNIGVQTSMITGDNSRTAEAVRRNLGLDECVSEMKPHEKLEWIQQKQNGTMAQGSTVPPNGKCNDLCSCFSRSRDPRVLVGMVGDGVNDGPALASANVGIAMGAGGTALAVEAADVALMSSNLARIPELICLAKFCSLIVKQNIVLSVLLKIIIVIVALSGYATLWMAVVADVMGLLFVIINGLRPLMWKASNIHTMGSMDIGSMEVGLTKKAESSHKYDSIV